MQMAKPSGRWFVFFFCIFVLLGLLAIALLYANGAFDSVLPSRVPRPALVAAWSGALGGVAIRFKGVFDHKTERGPGDKPDVVLWDDQLLPWHLGRPFTGIIVGLFVFLALKTAYPSGNPSSATLGAASFVLGTQDRAFFDFVKQIGAIVVSIPKKTKGANDADQSDA